MKTAIYPGSFDPVTNGHLDIIKRASTMFDKLIVVVLINPLKSYSFSIAERRNLLEKATEGMKISKLTAMTVCLRIISICATTLMLS